MPKVFNVTIDGDFVIVAGAKGIIYAGTCDSSPDWIKEAVKQMNCD